MAMKEIKITDFEGCRSAMLKTRKPPPAAVLLFGKDGAPAGLDVRGGDQPPAKVSC